MINSTINDPNFTIEIYLQKMMFGLYRVRCGLPVIVFGEAGVGKSALFRFLIETLLGHQFYVCNVNSGTTVADVDDLVVRALQSIEETPEMEVFLFFDEMNTADAPVIAFLKELMIDRFYNGARLPDGVHLMAAANPYRRLKKTDRDAAVGLAFQFAKSSQKDFEESRSLVYRVNPIPSSFYDYIYDFGQLCDDAEETYIEEICQTHLAGHGDVASFIEIVKKSHKAVREFSTDPFSAVSLRDATRATQLFRWFNNEPAGRQIAIFEEPGRYWSRSTQTNRAQTLAIYLAYALRFREVEKRKFLDRVFGRNHEATIHMREASQKIARKLFDQAHGASIGCGAIALNDALCENLFALYVCVLNRIFLIIVGRPGSSKSLSVEILKLVLSPGNSYYY